MAKFKLLRLDSPGRGRDDARIPFRVGASLPQARHSRMPFRSLASALGGLFGRTSSQPGAGGIQSPTFQMVRRGITREINRARRFKRPLSVLVLRTDILRTGRLDVGAFVSLQRLRDTDLWFHDPVSGELIVVAPETTTEAANILGQRLAIGLGTDSSVTVTWSSAVFPRDGLTFETLYDVAEARITAPADQCVIDARGHA